MATQSGISTNRLLGVCGLLRHFCYNEVRGVLFIYVFIILVCLPTASFASSSPDSLQNDFFPLSIGRKMVYSFSSSETIYDALYPVTHVVDSGTVRYEIVGLVGNDSTNLWSVQETDSILRTIQDYYTGDTSYAIDTT